MWRVLSQPCRNVKADRKTGCQQHTQPLGETTVSDLHPLNPPGVTPLSAHSQPPMVFPAGRPGRAVPVALCAAVLVAGCAAQPGVTQFNDPYEPTNREIHEFNRDVDTVVLRPGSNIYGTILPQPVRRGIGNFARNLNAPGDVVNNFLQGDVENGVANTFRFLINSTVGIAGLFDPATAIGLPNERTSFGETLFVWGVPEGAYLELPLFGPSTQRATLGGIVDIIIDPLRIALPSPESYVSTAATIAAGFGYRYDYSAVIDGILYESADSYAQSRLLYLQNQRFELGDTGQDENFDPYEDPYAQ